ncbi:glycosyltransferase family 4 protein [Primorskyibacter sp. S187A]|uniref:glycosyltransferase family 4 protein n=1 Tax=Primorskyibacter sp. S187A TaxID=3415130 RepID=UPI003C7BAFF4
MNILIIHQNFPGQYKHLAPALAARGDRVVALTPKVDKATTWNGVRVLPYKIGGKPATGLHPWLVDFETKLLRAHSCYNAAMKVKEAGFMPDVILAHHGWGESLFLKDVWPDARLGLYCELYHINAYPFVNFDPEFPSKNPASDGLRLRLKNLNNRLHFEVAEAGISPTQFQADTFPPEMLERITISHDGIDTQIVQPNADARLQVRADRVLSRDDEVITFINRNLEPYRGYHVFMRTLPKLLKARPNAEIVIIGGDGVSYGARPPGDKSWKQIFIDEVRPQISDADWGRVHFLGRVPYNVFLSMMQVSRAHVYLTYPFVLSWSLMEAMAAGAPIIASDTAPVKEVLQDGKNGLLVDFFDQDAIVRRVGEMLDSPELAGKLRAQAREDVVRTYDLKTVCLPRQLAWVDELAACDPRAPAT